jgi:hypothetical protein
MLGDDGNQIGAHSALRTLHSALERLFSGIHFGMDDWGERARGAPCRRLAGTLAPPKSVCIHAHPGLKPRFLPKSLKIRALGYPHGVSGHFPRASGHFPGLRVISRWCRVIFPWAGLFS